MAVVSLIMVGKEEDEDCLYLRNEVAPSPPAGNQGQEEEQRPFGHTYYVLGTL